MYGESDRIGAYVKDRRWACRTLVPRSTTPSHVPPELRLGLDGFTRPHHTASRSWTCSDEDLTGWRPGPAWPGSRPRPRVEGTPAWQNETHAGEKGTTLGLLALREAEAFSLPPVATRSSGPLLGSLPPTHATLDAMPWVIGAGDDLPFSISTTCTCPLDSHGQQVSQEQVARSQRAAENQQVIPVTIFCLLGQLMLARIVVL